MAKKETPRIELNQCTTVHFYGEGEHTYTDDDLNEYVGVTTILHKYLFKDKYDAVPEAVLAQAAERGSQIHRLCEIADIENKVDEVVFTEYIQLRNRYKAEHEAYDAIMQMNKLQHEASEYLVTDNTFVASCIDKVYRVNDNTFILADIKTTSKLDERYVSWQLSIYKYLFLQQNPGAKVSKLYAIWLRKDIYQFVEVPEIPKEYVEQLLFIAKNNEAPSTYTDPTQRKELTQLPAEWQSLEEKWANILEQSKLLEEEKKKLTDQVKQYLTNSEEDIASIEGQRIIIRKSLPGRSFKFNESKFAEEHPELYKQYIQLTITSPRVNITLK